MKRKFPIRWWSLAFGIAVSMLLVFFIATGTGLAIEDTSLLRNAGPYAAVAGFLLLVADVFLPVPSSLVMVAHGTLFGVIPGALLSVAGSVASALTGFAVGRAGTKTIRRFVTPEEHERASQLLDRWGLTAVAATRPVPILAETVAILAGGSRLGWWETAIAATVGSIIPAAAYAWTGAHAGTITNHALMFGGVMLASAALWWVGSRRKRASEGDADVLGTVDDDAACGAAAEPD